MRTPVFWLSLLLFAGIVENRAAQKTQAGLLLSMETAKPGETITAAIDLKMAPKWHTYWKNGGDSGSATKVQWTLPSGWTAGEIQWPLPEKIETAGLYTYVYHDRVLLPVALSIPANAAPGEVEIKAKVSWLECMDVCLPGRSEVSGKIRIGPASNPSGDAALIQSWEKKIPRKDPAQVVRARLEGPEKTETRNLIIEWEKGSAAADFFPYAADDFEIGNATERAQIANGIALSKSIKKSGGNWPKTVSGVVVSGTAGGPNFEVDLTLGGTVSSASPAPAAKVPASAPAAPILERQSFAWILLLAFLGGLILNVMPCVLPVIALKIFGFVNQSREEPRRIRNMGLIYGAGVLVSFLVLALLVIAVKQAGRSANWGMQFQNPVFLVIMTALVTLVALNLFGLFEVTLSGGALNAAGNLASQEGYPGAFFNGVLATALGTPCTAPFLSVALGFAFSQPAIYTIAVFLMVGIGLAFPYVLLSFQPAWLRFLPKPGAWMEKFRTAMGFPMIATAIWLFTLAAPNFGPGGPFWLGIFLTTLALAAWVWGEFFQRSQNRRGLAAFAALALLAGAYGGILEHELHWRSPQLASSGAGVHREQDGIEWEKWTPGAVAKAREQGRPVLVDFTADWCAICQVNKRTSIEIESVRSKLKEIQAVALLADYTREDPQITEELAKFQRAAVPLVLVYPADRTKPPVVLPSLLTPAIMLDALSQAGAARSSVTSR